jgi:hypothetical protein
MRLIGSLVIAGDVVVIGGRGTRGIRGACVLELVEDDLGDCLAHGNPRATEFPFTEVVASRVVVGVFYLPLLQSEVAGMALAGEVMAVGMVAAASVRAGVQHLVPEETMVAGNLAPARCRDRTEMMGRFAVGGEMIVPQAVGATLLLLELVLCYERTASTRAIRRIRGS